MARASVKDWKGDVYKAALAKAQQAALEETGAAAVAPAMARTPVVTGTAQGSIGFRPAVRVGNMWIVVFGSFNVVYFIWLEIGAKGRPGIHMLQQAADQEMARLKERIRKHAAAAGIKT